MLEGEGEEIRLIIESWNFNSEIKYKNDNFIDLLIENFLGSNI